MLKIRITYNKNKPSEVKSFINNIKEKGYTVLSESRPYAGRGESEYANIYLDVEEGLTWIKIRDLQK